MITNETLKTIPLGRIVGIDYGQKRIGVAMSDPMQKLSSTLVTIDNTSLKKSARKIVEIVDEHIAVAVIVGMPINMDGSKGDSAETVLDFMTKLRNRLPKIPVLPWDERWSTKSASDILIESGKSPSKNRHIIDQIAAKIILQAFLDRLDFFKRSQEGL